MKYTVYALIILFLALGSSCKRRGCRSDVLCVDNYDPKAERDGDCSGCTVFGAVNYCPEADRDNGLCQFQRKFYTDIKEEGWIDVWVADSAENSNINRLRYEGRINKFPEVIPECESLDSTLTVIRFPGEYYYEIETQTGKRDWGWVLYREEGCRLLDVY
ncbi:MAG: hypothetical protein Salg2KO_03800 [Salibacteraceae bacterium]